MRICIPVITFAMLLASGCSHDEVRVENPDANGPIVNPLAPGARNKGNTPALDREYTAPPGTKTGIPK